MVLEVAVLNIVPGQGQGQGQDFEEAFCEAPQIHRLFQRDYAVEAKLINVRDFPPLLRSCREIQEAKSEFFGIRSEAELRAGLVVDPDYFRLGLACLLLEHVMSVFPDRALRVETATANLPAMALYASLGFVERGEYAKTDGLRMSRLEMKRT